MIKIVTAFFDINRDQSKVIPRSNAQYFEYFKFWARLRNDLTIYCESKNAGEILKIREDLGLKEKTHIVVIDNLLEIEADVFQKMVEIENNEDFKNFRWSSNALSNQAKYNYIMLMKFWCLQDAASKVCEDCKIAWLDFGYNHGGEKYTNPEDFDFEWDYQYSDKINAFCLSNPDNVSLIDSLQFQTDCFIGHTWIMPVDKASWFWINIKEAMITLLKIGCMDDDQMLELIVYKNNPELFDIHISSWFEDFLICGNHHFDVKSKKGNYLKDNLKSVYHELKKPKNTFLKRTKKRIKKYYS